MADGSIHGVGGQQPRDPSKVGQQSKPQTGTYRNLAVTLMPQSKSAIATARTEAGMLAGESAVSSRIAAYEAKGSKASAKSRSADDESEVEEGGSEGEEDKKNKKTSAKGGVRIVNNVEDMLGNRQYSAYEARLRRMGKFRAVQEYLDLTHEFFSDPTEAYLAMRQAQESLSKGSSENESDDTRLKDFSAGLNQAATLYYEENGADIRAGFNLFFPKSEVDEYRQQVLRFSTVPETYEAIMSQAAQGKSDFKEKLSFLISAIGTDLDAARPTLDPVQLNKILQELQRVQYCQGLHESCSLLLDNMQELYGN